MDYVPPAYNADVPEARPSHLTDQDCVLLLMARIPYAAATGGKTAEQLIRIFAPARSSLPATQRESIETLVIEDNARP